MIARCQGFMYSHVTGGVEIDRCCRSGRLYIVDAEEDEPEGEHLLVLCKLHVQDAPNPEPVEEPDCGDGWVRDRLGTLFIYDEAKSFVR